jgi:hypothetical protein
MLGISPDPITRHLYLPTDNVGRLYCWPCWDKLEKENPKLYGHIQQEECDHCGNKIQLDLTPIWKIERTKNGK